MESSVSPMFPKSIRWRLQLWLAFLLACILSGFGLTAYQLHRTNRLTQIDEDLTRRVATLSADARARVAFFGQPPGRPPFNLEPGRDVGPDVFAPPSSKLPSAPGGESPFSWRPGAEPRTPRSRPAPRELRLSSQTQNLFDEADTNGFYYAVWSRGNVPLKHSTNAPAAVAPPEHMDAEARIRTQMRENCREAFYFNGMGDCILVGRPIGTDLETLHRFAWLLVAVGGAVLTLGMGGGWWLANRAIRPVENISAAASRISAGHLSERINVSDTDSELGRLAGVLNSTFARLETAFAQQKQFTGDASHELRTPLAVIISEAQTTLARERTAAEYRETVEACLSTAQQMSGLTKSLLELARIDAGQEPIQRQPFDLAERARADIELIRPLAKQRGLRIACDLQSAPSVGDTERLSQVVTNLLTNAIHYNTDQGEIRVSTRSEKQSAVLTVSDTGIGISAEDLPHVFERFYRADKSRARANGRSGLGLAICKAIVDAHGGTIEVSSQPGAGSTFTLRLPA